MVKYFRQKFRVPGTGAVIQAVINDENIFAVIAGQWLHKAADDPSRQKGCKTLPVCFRTVQETVNRVFREALLKGIRFHLHIHAPVGKHQAKQIAEDIHNRNPLFFTRVAFEQQPADLEVLHKICNKTGNIIFIMSILWYTGHGINLLAV